jgi:hypothetical protein
VSGVRVDEDNDDDYYARPKNFGKFLKAADDDVLKAFPKDAIKVSPFTCTNENREPCHKGEAVDKACNRNVTCEKPWREKHKGPWMPCCKKLAMFELLVWFHNAVGPVDVDGNGFWYSINGGTLLGSLRNEDIVDWTTDVDVIVPKEYEKFVEKALKKAIKGADAKYGFTVDDGKGQEDTRRLNFGSNNAIMDVFFAHEFQNSDRAVATRAYKSKSTSAFSGSWLLPTPSIPNRTEIESGKTKPCVKYWEDAFPITWLFPLKMCTIQGKEFPCIQKAEDMMAFNYGKDWKTPDGKKPEGRVAADCDKKPAN